MSPIFTNAGMGILLEEWFAGSGGRPGSPFSVATGAGLVFLIASSGLHPYSRGPRQKVARRPRFPDQLIS
jgi:hypothetical protein